MKALGNSALAIWKDESGISTMECTVLLVLAAGGLILLSYHLDTTAQFGTGWAG